MALHFPPQQAYDFGTDTVGFPAIGDKGLIPCRVERGVFEKHFNTGGSMHGEDLVGIFLANRSAILAKARSLIEAGRLELNGSFVLREADFDPPQTADELGADAGTQAR